MSVSSKVLALEHALHTANTWIRDVAEEFDTEDREFAYRVLRAWLHTLRDRLGVEVSAHFAAQLPDLVRGVFYAGWNPSEVPAMYDAEGYRARFARDAGISVHDVGKAAPATTTAVLRHLPPAQIDKVLNQLPEEIRALLRPVSKTVP
ncbi:uncharacterized protein (DUF2267 family) [Pseudonocardia hierapolitana]|uniref:Uncharacterized protein (DUF2267 family) n=1 Tax=Pseudonocardia hierapolitana TaxID=1128676 RepID=A0A561T573_9PSEU|nr:DUF2267 domain-containing protein [Pseudonocardia hierapolitana]TWF82254.1 uncharacterized protein (DUF2267 family) [Pseudonocardia hierapolitana]